MFYPPVPIPRSRKRLHPLTWVIIVVNVLFAAWAFAVLVGRRSPAQCAADFPEWWCATGRAVFVEPGVWLTVGLWLAADLVLIVAWATRYGTPVGDPVVGRVVPLADPAESGYVGPETAPPAPRPAPVRRSGGWKPVQIWAFCAAMVLLCTATFGAGVWLGREQGRVQEREATVAVGALSAPVEGVDGVADRLGCRTLVPTSAPVGALEAARCELAEEAVTLYLFGAADAADPTGREVAEAGAASGYVVWTGSVMIDAVSAEQAADVRWLLGQ